MEDEPKHYPPGAEPEPSPAPDAPAPEGDKAPEGEQSEGQKPDGEKPEAGEDSKAPEAKTPEDGQPKDPPADPAPIKKRSIYDDYKDEKGKRKDAEARAAELEAENARLKAGDPPKDPAASADPAEPKDELASFAEENGMDAAGLNRLVEIIQKRIPTAELSETDKQDLASLRTWRQEQQRSEEDRAVLSTAQAVKQQLSVHDDKELDTVMKEVLRLAHTKEFADKEVEYIVWKNQDALSKLVSPKRPSFEAGAGTADPAPAAEVDFSSGKITPEQAAKAVYEDRPRTSLEVRRSQ